MYEDNSRISLDLDVIVYNINDDKNNILKNDCKPLDEYMRVVGFVKEYAFKFGYTEESIGEAVTKAINYMPDSFAIKKLLVYEKKEVISMLFEEFNEELYKKAAIDDAKASYESGKKEERISVIKNALSLKLSVKDIAKLTSLSEQEVEIIISELN